MSRRHIESTLTRGDALTDVATTKQYLQQRLRAYPYEVFACLFLDNKHRMIAFDELFRGTIDGASVYPREVVKQALAHNAAAVIFDHNHPYPAKLITTSQNVSKQHYKWSTFGC
jgi:DNA repair protein RadC